MIEVAATKPIEPLRSPINWGAIWGGWVVAMGIAWLFYIVGLAVGFSAFDVNNPEAVGKGIGIGTAIWLVLTWAVSLFLGGMFASWLDGKADTTVGTLHGVAVWGLASTFTVLLMALGFTNLLQGGASLVRGAVTAGGAAAAAAAAQPGQNVTPMDRASVGLQAQLRRSVAARSTAAAGGAPGTTPGGAAGTTTGAATPGTTSTATAETRTTGPQLDRDTTAAVAADLLRGRNDDAKARLAADTGMSSADVDATLQSMNAQIERARADAKDAAEKAARYSAAAMWVLFATAAIALIAAALGGTLGAGHIHRVYDTRAY